MEGVGSETKNENNMPPHMQKVTSAVKMIATPVADVSRLSAFPGLVAAKGRFCDWPKGEVGVGAGGRWRLAGVLAVPGRVPGDELLLFCGAPVDFSIASAGTG